MQKLFAVVVPLCAVLWGLVTLRVVRKQGRRLGDPEAIGAVLFIAYGALTLNNLSLRGLSLLGNKVLGYGPRYGAVADLAGACLFLAALLWGQALRRGPQAPLDARDKRAVAIQAGLLVAFLVAAGLIMEALRNAEALPWQAH